MPAWMISARPKTTQTPSSAKQSQSSPDSVSTQVATLNNGGIKPFAVSFGCEIQACLQYRLLYDQKYNSKCFYPQTKTVHTTWCTQSAGAHVPTPAPTLLPVKHVIFTVTRDAPALMVSTLIVRDSHWMAKLTISFMFSAYRSSSEDWYPFCLF